MGRTEKCGSTGKLLRELVGAVVYELASPGTFLTGAARIDTSYGFTIRLKMAERLTPSELPVTVIWRVFDWEAELLEPPQLA